jgi:hypothetical protein
MFGCIRGIFSKTRRRERRVVKELNEAKTCILRKDLRCTLAHLEEATRYDDCTICRQELQVFKKQVRRLPMKDRLKKVDLLIKISGPAAFIVPKMKQIRMIKPTRQQRKKQQYRRR